MEHDTKRKLTIGQQKWLELCNRWDLDDLCHMLEASANVYAVAGNSNMNKALVEMRNRIKKVERQLSGEKELLEKWTTSAPSA